MGRTIIVAPDSFKGTLTARQAAQAIRDGIVAALPERAEDIVLCPVADGGEGTLDVLVPEHRRITVTVSGPDSRPVRARYGYRDGVAVIESAQAAGLTLLPTFARSAGAATTYGVGEMIRHAMDRGATKFLLTVGGSATNDGGCGLLSALGAKFLNAGGTAFVPTGDTLSQIDRIDLSGLDPRLAGCHFSVATDVANLLCGTQGATRVYAPQKSAGKAMLDRMEGGMIQLAYLLRELSGKDVFLTPGAGAGGGIAAPLIAFADTEIVSGIDAVLKALDFDKKLKNAEAVITGEGRIDRQSLCGKVVSGVCRAAAKAGVPVWAAAGCLGDEKEELTALGLQDVFTVLSCAHTTEAALGQAAFYLAKAAEQFGPALEAHRAAEEARAHSGGETLDLAREYINESEPRIAVLPDGVSVIV